MEFQDIDEYITLPQEKRQAHLQLSSACIIIGTKDSGQCRALLAHFLKTTVPDGRRKIHLCHACHNTRCSNPRHLYWGTAKENTADRHNKRKSLFGKARKKQLEKSKVMAQKALERLNRLKIQGVTEV